MRVAVAGDVEVEVVGELATRQRDVEQVAVFVTGEDDVAGAGGDALGAVDGGGVPELDGLGDVVGGQGDGLAELVVDHAQGAVGVDLLDVPAVAVLDPVGAADA